LIMRLGDFPELRAALRANFFFVFGMEDFPDGECYSFEKPFNREDREKQPRRH
jgi:hypothetical protein